LKQPLQAELKTLLPLLQTSGASRPRLLS
jgi:hypothetical protein